MKIHNEEIIIDIITEYFFDLYLPDHCWETGVISNFFETRSYTSFICKELIHRVMAYNGDNTIDVLVDFICEMDKFRKINNKTKLVFELAYDIGVDIFEMCRAAGIAE